MKRIVFAASLVLAAGAAQAEGQLEIGVEMTPAATQKADKADRRFENYALETASSGGQ